MQSAKGQKVLLRVFNPVRGWCGKTDCYRVVRFQTMFLFFNEEVAPFIVCRVWNIVHKAEGKPCHAMGENKLAP